MTVKEKMISKIEEVGVRTLEQLAFLFLVPIDAECDHEDPIEVRVEFEGLYKGAVYLRVSAPMAHEIAQNMLGIDGASDRGVVEDALKECVNVLCGNILPELFGKREVFKIHGPERVEEEIGDLLEKEMGLLVSFESDEGSCLSIGMLLDRPLETVDLKGDEVPND